MTRIKDHPILGKDTREEIVTITFDGKEITALKGEMIASALIANGVHSFRYTEKHNKPRGIYCGIGRCTDCVMIVDGIPNVRTCVTEVKDGMKVETQYGRGEWKNE
ncbi:MULTISPECIES: (2Fe-2S)-binding protein [Sedimentibacter]|uniref:(2Fe-2S)-binding protein n=1 Tax=Sedimentibacter hydroxybenzoicus DSM 7310 TaxID=1123245 RepID=A0A974BNA6_SEDHY|nr:MULTISPECIES: (2Fe-2S)-binding protein [Sedimentibacter]NYB76106.1 (2Fe-2S)-binding protein [Sedimentibacter hydroxybenzoicus DSM 7310]HCX62024.1 dehydrogenase [Clostridiales bacterium]